MPNTIDVGLKKEALHNEFLQAFTLALLSLSSFSTDFSADAVDVGDKVKVGYAPLASAAIDFAGTYTIQSTDWQKKEVSIDKHKFVSMGISDKEIASTPMVSLLQQVKQKAYQLAKAVLTDILSIVTNANYSTAVFTGAASGFDLDDVADIRTACVKAGWPAGARSLVLAADYYGAVIKDNNFQDAAAAGSTATRETGTLPTLYSFTPIECEVIPANAENLVGFATLPSAAAVAMRYLKPLKPEAYTDARALTDPATGITIGFREAYDPYTGVLGQFYECNYGYAALETAALKRIVSA